jgi:hypothetical protein
MHRALCSPSEEFPSLLFCSWQGDYMLKSNSYKLQSLVSSHLELLSGLTTIFLGGIHFFLKHVADRFRIFEKAPLPCSRFPFFKLVFATPKFSTPNNYYENYLAMDLPRRPNTEEETDSYEIKELFIEACVREWLPEYFSEVVSPNNLQAMSMLDSSALENLEPGTPLYSGSDLFASLRHEMSSVARENWLRQHLRTHLQDQDFQNKVGARFDKDLRDAGMPHLMGVSRKMVDKVCI